MTAALVYVFPDRVGQIIRRGAAAMDGLAASSLSSDARIQTMEWWWRFTLCEVAREIGRDAPRRPRPAGSRQG